METMPLNETEKTACDVLIIGGGGAGLRASIAAAAVEKAMKLDTADGFDTVADDALARLESLFADKGQKPAELVKELKATMWRNAGIVRDRQSLNRALETIMERKDVPVMVKSTRDLMRM